MCQNVTLSVVALGVIMTRVTVAFKKHIFTTNVKFWNYTIDSYRKL